MTEWRMRAYKFIDWKSTLLDQTLFSVVRLLSDLCSYGIFRVYMILLQIILFVCIYLPTRQKGHVEDNTFLTIFGYCLKVMVTTLKLFIAVGRYGNQIFVKVDVFTPKFSANCFLCVYINNETNT
jgi:hypothetical protein